MMSIYKGSRVRLAEAEEPEGVMLGIYGLFLCESPPSAPPQRMEREVYSAE